MNLRSFTSNDYPALTRVYNTACKGDPLSAIQIRTQDKVAQRRLYGHFYRYVVEHKGSIVAFATYDQPFYLYKPFTYRITLVVHPAYQQRGIGSALYTRVMRDLLSLGASSVWVQLCEEMVDGERFFRKRGFQQDHCTYELHLSLSSFDHTLYADNTQHLVSQGIKIRTLHDVRADTDYQYKLYHLYKVIYSGLSVYNRNHTRLLDFVEYQQDLGNKSPEAYFVAQYDTIYIGLSYLTFPWHIDHCSVGLTGVQNAYHNNGIARTLKLRGVAYAREQGFSVMRTFNDANNVVMLGLNERLGFTRERTWITYQKTLSYERPTIHTNDYA